MTSKITPRARSRRLRGNRRAAGVAAARPTTAVRDAERADRRCGRFRRPVETPLEDVPASADHPYEHTWNPITRMTRRLPHWLRVTIDWIVTIVGAIAIVLFVKAYIVNPYRIPSSSMESTLHCAYPATGCEAEEVRPRAREPVPLPPPRSAPGRDRRVQHAARGSREVRRRWHVREAADRASGRDHRGASREQPRLRLHQREEARRAVHRELRGGARNRSAAYQDRRRGSTS